MNAEIVIRALKETDSHNMTPTELKKFKNTLISRQTELEVTHPGILRQLARPARMHWIKSSTPSSVIWP